VLEKGTNLAAYIDSLVLQGHMWQQTKTWDPEGVLSTLPSIATVLFGVLAGQLLRLKLTPAEKTAWLFTGGSALIVAALVMSIWMPFNKNLWTSSYAVLMAGLASSAFAFFYWVIDVQGRQKWARPFVIYGMNAIAIYVFAGTLGDALSLGNLQRSLYGSVFAPLAPPKMASLLYAVCFLAVTFAVAWGMYRKKWFVRI
jgi:predicted acyltransferase